jgi:plastocyanin
MHGPRMKAGRWSLAVVGLAALALPGAAHATTYTVQVGGPAPAVEEADLQAYYPRTTQVHVGDQVEFGFAGFHTVTFLPGASRTKDIVPLPIIEPTGAGTYPLTNDAAGNPFWWGGAAPILGFNPDVAAPTASTTVDGTQLVGSGLPSGPTFTVTFAKAGSFAFYCALHPHQRGLVKVLPAKRSLPSPDAQAAKGQAQLAADQANAVALDAKVDARPPTSKTVLVGRGTKELSLLGFYPHELHAHVGQTVTFKWASENEVHNVVFGPQPLLDSLRASLFGAFVDPVGGLPSEPPGSGTPVLTPDLHGNGFLNSGLLPDSSPGWGPGFKVTFARAGTYHFECLIHDGMVGDVVVS